MHQGRAQPRADSVSPGPGVALARARAHEAAGVGRRVFALLVAGAMTGPVLWLHSRWETDRLNGDGIRAFVDPGRLIFGTARTGPELLQAAEDALRAGVIPLVVVEPPSPPGLTPVRRLHLAAETGAETARQAPLALLLTPGTGGIQGVETRWQVDPRRNGRWQLTRSRARMAPPESREMGIAEGRMRFETGAGLPAGHDPPAGGVTGR